MAGTKNIETSSISQPAASPGPFLAKVVGHMDPNYMGGLEVEILRPVGGSGAEGQLHQVKYMSPFYGVTSFDFVTKDSDKFDDTQKSYGMWMIPPDPGTTVVVIFIDGDPKRGFWIGCVQDEHMNFMIPGMAGTAQALNDKDDNFLVGKDGSTLSDTKLPVAEYNKLDNNSTGDTTQNKKPTHPFARVLINNGLDRDDIRGTTSSSARRETPSSVFGISTPGPLDKDGISGAVKKGKIGKKEHAINAPVSRKGGSTFVMDDGDDKFVRKTSPAEGGPDYAAIEQDDKPGDMGHRIPHNELVRIRTRTGHQILLHNSEDIIYIAHGSGNSWFEMTANGKIDVYAKDSISFHTETDVNFHAGRDITFQADRNINIKSLKDMQVEVIENYTLKVTKAGNLTFGGKLDIPAAGGTNIDGGQIHLNSGKAVAAKPLKIHTLPLNEQDKTIDSITRRVPTFEPYPQHENLDPIKFNSEAIDRDIDGRLEGVSETLKEPPEVWKKYTTNTDTFQKIKGS